MHWLQARAISTLQLRTTVNSMASAPPARAAQQRTSCSDSNISTDWGVGLTLQTTTVVTFWLDSKDDSAVCTPPEHIQCSTNSADRDVRHGRRQARGAPFG